MRIEFIEGYEKLYKVTDDGRIISFLYNPEGKTLKPGASENDYLTVVLTKDKKRTTKKLHRIVAEHFVPNPNPEEYDILNHLDGNKQNNHYTNLEWGTQKQNVQHYFNVLGGKREGVGSKKRIIRISKSGEVVRYKSLKDAAEDIKTHAICISKALRGITKTHRGFIWEYDTK